MGKKKNELKKKARLRRLNKCETIAVTSSAISAPVMDADDITTYPKAERLLLAFTEIQALPRDSLHGAKKPILEFYDVQLTEIQR